jgi:hypothetical protein
LEKYHKKLKARVNKFNNFSSDKRYEMDDNEESFDDFKQSNVNVTIKPQINLEEQKNQLQDIINIKTDYFTNTSNSMIPKYGTKPDKNSSSENEEDIVDKYNKIIFYSQEHKLNMVNEGSRKNLTHPEGGEKKLEDMSEDFSHISPLLTFNKKKKSKIINSFQKGQGNKVYWQRHDSFILPRTQSKIKFYQQK